MPLVGIGELAHELRRDAKGIRNLVEKGALTRRPDGLFDLETALAEWAKNVNHAQNRYGPAVDRVPPQVINPDAEIPDKPTKAQDYAKAKAATQIYEARLKKLRYEERAKNLAPVCDIEDARYREMRVIRDACLNLPSRVSAQFAAEADEHKIYQMLEDEIIAIFHDFAEGRLQ